MKTEKISKGTWIHRFAIWLFTLFLTILVFWVLGFFVDDIRSLPGPNYAAIEKEFLDKGLVEKKAALEDRIARIARRIDNQAEKQRVLGDSSRSLQQTISQLLELQKLGIEKGIPYSQKEQTNFTNSMNLFLENQRRYQELSRVVSELLEKKQELLGEKEQIEKEIKKQRKPAGDRFRVLSRKHRLKLAFLQLAILIPILIPAAVIIIRKRSSIYFPLFLAVGAATLIKVAFVVHQYFPSRIFKYVLIGGLLLVVGRLLIHFIRTVAFPKKAWLVKQYREAYERFLCPVCEYPIRIGPRRFLFWTRRTVNKVVIPVNREDREEEYTCPSCGSTLFEKCSNCRKIRHTMLPHCAHCGAGKEIG